MEALPTIELPSTPSIKFTGKIHPTSFKISLSSNLTAGLMIQPGTPHEGLNLRFNFTIKDSEVDVNCYLNQVIQSNELLSQVHFHAYELVRSAVDLLAFSTGRGLTLIFDKAMYPDGTVLDV